MLRRLRRNRAFTLVELMIVVAIVGLLAALAIYGVRKYMTNAKTAEARNALGAISKGAQTAFDKEIMEGSVLDPGGTVQASNRLCTSATAAVPSDPDKVKGLSYQSTGEDWNNTSDGPLRGWQCLKFEMKGPQRFQYNYTSNGVDEFTAIARGNLDGDDDWSTFEIKGAVQGDDAGNQVLAVSPAIIETNPDE